MGIAQWLGRQTRDRKVESSSPHRRGGKMFSSRVRFLCWPLFRYRFHPCVTAVARKRSRSFCQRFWWQVTAKHVCTVRMWLCMKWRDMVHGCMVCPELAETPAVSRGTMRPCNDQTALSVHRLDGYLKRAVKSYSHSFRTTCDKSVASLLESVYIYTHTHTYIYI